MARLITRRGCLLLIAICTASCSDSSDHPATGDCPDNHLVGRWQHSFTATTVTFEFKPNGEYSRLERINELDRPGFLTTGTYQLGRQVVNESGLEVCEFQTFVGITPPSCTEHVLVEDAVLYFSDCDLQLDFDAPYNRTRDVFP